MSRALRHRGGGAFIEELFFLSAAAVAVITAAYVYMPDFQRGIWSLIGQVEIWLLGF